MEILRKLEKGESVAGRTVLMVARSSKLIFLVRTFGEGYGRHWNGILEPNLVADAYEVVFDPRPFVRAFSRELGELYLVRRKTNDAEFILRYSGEHTNMDSADGEITYGLPSAYTFLKKVVFEDL